MMIIHAAQFAREAHAGQKRKYDGRDYITHPARVAGMVALHPDSSATWVAAAYLHDVLEDTDTTVEQLRRSFSPEVVRIVVELTNTEEGNRATRKRLSNARLAGSSRATQIIKLLDREDNLTDLYFETSIWDTTTSFLRRYAEETKDLVAAIGYADKEIAARLLRLVKVAKDADV
jgi:(p)ppGpp synthase/HD superfamily hydrolase